MFLKSLLLSLVCLSAVMCAENVYWQEISQQLADPNSDLVRIKNIDSPGALSVLLRAELVQKLGKKLSFLDTVGLLSLNATLQSLGKFMVIQEQEAPRLHAFISDLAHQMNIPKPLIIYSDNNMVNAFALSFTPSNGFMVLYRGILEKSSNAALEGVIAHEMGHIMHNHVAKQTAVKFASFLLVALSIYAAPHLPYVPAGKAAHVVRPVAGIASFSLAIGLIACLSRRHERQADAAAAKYVGHKGIRTMELLAQTQDKLARGDFEATTGLLQSSRFAQISKADSAQLKTELGSQQAAYDLITNQKSWLFRVLATHPKVADRLAAMKNMVDDQENGEADDEIPELPA